MGSNNNSSSGWTSSDIYSQWEEYSQIVSAGSNVQRQQIREQNLKKAAQQVANNLSHTTTHKIVVVSDSKGNAGGYYDLTSGMSIPHAPSQNTTVVGTITKSRSSSSSSSSGGGGFVAVSYTPSQPVSSSNAKKISSILQANGFSKKTANNVAKNQTVDTHTYKIAASPLPVNGVNITNVVSAEESAAANRYRGAPMTTKKGIVIGTSSGVVYAPETEANVRAIGRMMTDTHYFKNVSIILPKPQKNSPKPPAGYDGPVLKMGNAGLLDRIADDTSNPLSGAARWINSVVSLNKVQVSQDFKAAKSAVKSIFAPKWKNNVGEVVGDVVGGAYAVANDALSAFHVFGAVSVATNEEAYRLPDTEWTKIKDVQISDTVLPAVASLPLVADATLTRVAVAGEPDVQYSATAIANAGKDAEGAVGAVKVKATSALGLRKVNKLVTFETTPVATRDVQVTVAGKGTTTTLRAGKELRATLFDSGKAAQKSRTVFSTVGSGTDRAGVLLDSARTTIGAGKKTVVMDIYSAGTYRREGSSVVVKMYSSGMTSGGRAVAGKSVVKIVDTPIEGLLDFGKMKFPTEQVGSQAKGSLRGFFGGGASSSARSGGGGTVLKTVLKSASGEDVARVRSIADEGVSRALLDLERGASMEKGGAVALLVPPKTKTTGGASASKSATAARSAEREDVFANVKIFSPNTTTAVVKVATIPLAKQKPRVTPLPAVFHVTRSKGGIKTATGGLLGTLTKTTVVEKNILAPARKQIRSLRNALRTDLRTAVKSATKVAEMPRVGAPIFREFREVQMPKWFFPPLFGGGKPHLKQTPPPKIRKAMPVKGKPFLFVKPTLPVVDKMLLKYGRVIVPKSRAVTKAYARFLQLPVGNFNPLKYAGKRILAKPQKRGDIKRRRRII